MRAAQARAPRPAAPAAPERALRVLAVADYFLPGFKAGGPVRTLANLEALLAGEVELAVLTRDRDLGDAAPYPGVKADAWTEHAGIPVRYVSPGALSLGGLAAALRELDYDVLYLNSLWSAFTRRILLLRRLGRLPDRPVVLAPRGELAPGLLAQGTLKKRAYLAATRLAGLYRGVTWQVTSQSEHHAVAAVLGRGVRVEVAPNPSVAGAVAPPFPHPRKEAGAARLVYLSRVLPTKGLLEALAALRGVTGQVVFDVYGPVEDEAYWARCRAAMDALPANVACAYRGVVPPDRVEETFAGYHFFLFPTHAENFGHVVMEALRAGCPVLLSDRTPWRGLAAARAGWDVPLEDPARLRAALARAVAMDGPTWDAWAAGARAFARAAACSNQARDAYLDLFRRAAAGGAKRGARGAGAEERAAPEPLVERASGKA